LVDGLELGYRQDDQGLVIAPRKPEMARSNKLSAHQRVSVKRLEKMLEQKVNFNIINKPLSFVPLYFARSTHENFVLDPADRRAGLLDPKHLVNGSGQDVPLREALTQLLQPLKIGFEIRDESLVLTYRAQNR